MFTEVYGTRSRRGAECAEKAPGRELEEVKFLGAFAAPWTIEKRQISRKAAKPQRRPMWTWFTLRALRLCVKSALRLLNFRDQLRHHLEQIAYDTVIGDFEDGSFGILVDRYDGARAFHSHQVLDGSRDAHGQV